MRICFLHIDCKCTASIISIFYLDTATNIFVYIFVEQVSARTTSKSCRGGSHWPELKQG
jgi:hypothetical protein